MSRITEPRYCDYYSQLSYKDFCDRLAAGTLEAVFRISERTEASLLAAGLE